MKDILLKDNDLEIIAVEWVQAKHDPVAIEKRVKVQLERDGKDYERIKKQIKISNGQPL